MSAASKVTSAIWAVSFAALVAILAWWLWNNKSASKPPEKPTPPAAVKKIVKEDELNTIVLTSEAEKRIGLTLGLVQQKPVRHSRTYGGEAMIAPGRAILVAAPLSGTLSAPPTGMPRAGQTVKVGDTIFRLLPLLTPDSRATLTASLVDAKGQVENARTQLELARIALDRAKKVLAQGAGSQRMVDEAQAAFDLANKSLEAVLARQAILTRVTGDAETGNATPLSITSPANGVLRIISAQPNQTVPSGAALFEVIDPSSIWARVAVPVGDLDQIDRDGLASIGKLSAAPGDHLITAKPAEAPPSANPLTSTIDLFYELPAAGGKWSPGQRLSVTLPRPGTTESRIVPWSAIVYDIHGGTWVYEATAERTYVRRRVVVRHTIGPDAVLDAGPAVGARVVTAGAQELFGAETGFIK